MAINKKAILDALKADLRAADTLRLEIVSKVEKWRNEYEGRPYGNEQAGKSELVSRDIKRQDEWQHASVKDPFISDSDIVKCSPVTFEDRKAADQNQLLLNYQFTRQFNRYKFMTDVIKLYYAEGTAVIKTGWEYEDEEVEVDMPIYDLDPRSMQPIPVGMQKVKQLKVLKNKPTATICRLEDIYMDPTCMGDISKAQFVIHRYESDLTTLRRSKKYKNLNKLIKNAPESGASDADADFDPEDESEFKFGDEPRKKRLVYEYWGNFDITGSGIAKPIVCTWIDDTIIQLESNPMPDGELPFLIVTNNSTPFQLYGEAAAELIGDNQKIATAIKRGIMDNMANSNNAQKGIRKQSLDPLNLKRFLNGKNFEFNGSREDFFEGSYNQIPQSVFQVLEMTNSESESLLGVKSFSGGINGQTLGSTATSARGALDAVSVRRLDIVRNLAENLIKPLMRKWMAYNAEFLQEQEVVRITNEQFIPIARDDLKGAIDIQIEVSTAEDNSAKAQELSFLLQTLGQQLDPGMLKLLMNQIAKLYKMPDLAKQIEEYQPQPDPFTEQMKQLEMEKLKAEIEERYSRSRENATDVRAKTAKAMLDEARAANLGSDTDLKDLEFTRKADGVDFDEEMIKKEHDRGTQASLARMKNLTSR
jgi:hypothetical protein